MNVRLIHEERERTFAIVFDGGDEVVSGLLAFARDYRLGAGHFTAIGALSDVTLGYFDWQRKEYRKIPIDEQVEVLSLMGNVALHRGEPKVHAHVVVGRSDGTTRGGHLFEGHVRPTLEVVLVETPRHLQRTIDEETGLPLLSPPDPPGLPGGSGRDCIGQTRVIWIRQHPCH